MSIRPVGDFVQFSIGGGWGSEQPSEDFAPVAVIRGTDIPRLKNGDFSSIPNRFESEKKLKNRLLVPGDIVLETAGGSAATGQFTGRSLLVTEELLARTGPAICASFCKRIQLDTELIEPSFFQHFLEEMYSSGRVARYDSQSTGISNFQFKSFLESEMVDFPELPIQRAVSRVLRDIDAKRVLNFEVSNTLEALAGTIFKSWFIDFDPVRAKMAGESPFGIDAETAALFPDSMEDSELGEIPTGWSVGTLVDFFNLVMGQSPPGSAYNSEGSGEPFFQGRAEFGERFPTQRLSSTLGNRRATKGDVLVSVRAPVGDQNQALVDCIIGRGLAAIRHKSGSQAYSYEFVRSIQGQLDFFNGQGSVFGSISKRDFESLQVLEPPDALIQAFDSICSPIDELLRNLHVQNESLAGIRDALLPRLVSGELEIPDEMLAA